MVGQYLVHCYLYYMRHQPIIEDSEFDQICKDLLAQWDEIEHPHKHLISKEDLMAGTGYSIKIHDYPLIVTTIADTILEYKKQGKDYIKFMEDIWCETD